MTDTHLSRAEVRAFDRFAIDQLGIPAAVLMENAGRGAADALMGLGVRGTVIFCCGKGNNGGDGLVMARHLANRGNDTLSLLFADPSELTPDAALQWSIVRNMNLPTLVLSTKTLEPGVIDSVFQQADWIVDALFGTGLTGAVRPPFDALIKQINARGKRVLAVDIPSGLDCDTGLPMGATIRAEHTVTFVASKKGFQEAASRDYTGIVHVADIGVALSFGPPSGAAARPAGQG